MVFELPIQRWRRAATVALALLAAPLTASADSAKAEGYIREAQAHFLNGQYFKTARYAFAAQEEDPKLEAEASSWITSGLARSGLHNAASYFFIKTLQSGNKAAIRRVLPYTQEFVTRIGGDLLRKYLIRHTEYGDYDFENRSAYLYLLGKDALLAGSEEKALGYLNGMLNSSPQWGFALQLRGTANAILGRTEQALSDFRYCQDRARDLADEANSRLYAAQKTGTVDASGELLALREAEDLENRCLAGEARVLYQMDRFNDADRAYDRIPKASFVWTDILFEQAWNAFAKREYNRALGKLVSYKSPALDFVYNTEVDVLRAQSFLGLCLYADANNAINDFNRKYSKLGEEVKAFVEKNQGNLKVFYEEGKRALQAPLHTPSQFHKMQNRFVRAPYFQSLVQAERAIQAERGVAQRFASMQTGVASEPGRGFPGFLEQVLGWRRKSVQYLGGAYVKNSLMDYHAILIADFEKMAFIKLEMLGRAKEKLLRSERAPGDGGRARGDVEPDRRDDQYYWFFNGEFWNDELGDYVFGLESECSS